MSPTRPSALSLTLVLVLAALGPAAAARAQGCPTCAPPLAASPTERTAGGSSSAAQPRGPDGHTAALKSEVRSQKSENHRRPLTSDL